MVKENSIWYDSDGNWFRVLHVVEVDGNMWVHYRNESKGLVKIPVREHSCFVEAFEARFREKVQ
jgi:protein associated with RNAse G/E